MAILRERQTPALQAGRRLSLHLQGAEQAEQRRWIWATLGDMEAELADYLQQPVEVVRRRCQTAAGELAQAWQTADPQTPQAITSFYRQTDSYLYDLTWWHMLQQDASALIQVHALEVALEYRACTALDFGSGIGSLGLLLAQHGLAVTLADINHHLNDYARWRFARRGLNTRFLDLDNDAPPQQRRLISSAQSISLNTCPTHSIRWRGWRRCCVLVVSSLSIFLQEPIPRTRCISGMMRASCLSRCLPAGCGWTMPHARPTASS